MITLVIPILLLLILMILMIIVIMMIMIFMGEVLAERQLVNGHIVVQNTSEPYMLVVLCYSFV